jgi:hypothetical protein
MEPMFIIGGIILVILVIMGAAWWSDKKRTEGLQMAAEQIGLEFRREGDARLQQTLTDFQLFNQGRKRKLQNLVVGDTGDLNISIFDYQFTTGSGKHQHTANQTVVLLRSPDLEIPRFTLRPESMFDKIGGVLGLQKDINLEDFPVFSRMYLLKSEQEAAVRQLFHANLVQALEKNKRICIEAAPGQVIIYNARQRRKPEQLKSLFAEALEFFEHLTSRASSRAE